MNPNLSKRALTLSPSKIVIIWSSWKPICLWKVILLLQLLKHIVYELLMIHNILQAYDIDVQLLNPKLVLYGGILRNILFVYALRLLGIATMNIRWSCTWITDCFLESVIGCYCRFDHLLQLCWSNFWYWTGMFFLSLSLELSISLFAVSWTDSSLLDSYIM